MKGKIERGNSKIARIVNFAWSLHSPYCGWAKTDSYVDFSSFQQDALKKVFKFCSALRLRFERSEDFVCFSKRYSFKIYFY